MENNKTLILHDTFLYKGGGERLILMMAKSLQSDLASGFFSAGSFDLRKEGFKGKMISVSSEIFAKGFRHIKLKFAFLCKTKFLRDYETVIFSGDCISAVRNCSTSTKKIYYCHTPPRYLYDLNSLYLGKVFPILRPIFRFAFYVFRKSYERDIQKMDMILTNSRNTQRRIKEFLGIDAEVLYPPVDAGEFYYEKTGDYYLSFARLSTVKRVDRIVKAFQQMPEKKLVVIYGENDPQKQEIIDLARGYTNIELKTLPGNIGFSEYIANCIATIYIPVDEDFGMSPVESMAAGKPVLGVNEGGLKETLIHKKTGFLISDKAEISEIIAGVEYLSPENSIGLRENCEKRARDFSLSGFANTLHNYIDRCHQQKK